MIYNGNMDIFNERINAIKNKYRNYTNFIENYFLKYKNFILKQEYIIII